MKRRLNENIRKLLGGLQIGKMQLYEGMVVFPLFSSFEALEDCMGLDEAFEKECVEFKEVSDSGRVPELLAVNKCDLKILILEGQELKGAKQNRTLNTFILLPEHSETVIPVSCTEQGRWRYEKKHFDLTDKLVGNRVRKAISVSVKNNFMLGRKFESNQHQVWEEIDGYQRVFERFNATRSYDRLFEDLEGKVKKYEKYFPPEKGQTGMVVFIDAKLEGVDLVLNKKIYADNHYKILRSYVVDDLERKRRKLGQKSDWFRVKMNYDLMEQEMRKIIGVFWEETAKSDEFVSKSPGLGYEHRLVGDKVEGNFLVYHEKPVAAHLFPKEENKTGKMIDELF